MKKGFYKHYSGRIYKFICIASCSNWRNYVVYKEINIPHRIWMRPLSEFQANVESDVGPILPRFSYLGKTLKNKLR